MNKIFLSLIVLSTVSFGYAAPRNLKIQDLVCNGVKIKSFDGEPHSGIGLYLNSTTSTPEATVLTMRSGTGPSKKWGSVPVYIQKVNPKTGGGFQISGKPKVVFAGGGSASFSMNVAKVNGVWKASATVVYMASMRPASIREYKMICTGFKVQ